MINPSNLNLSTLPSVPLEARSQPSCPRCESTVVKVKDIVHWQHGKAQRYQCKKCKKIWSSYIKAFAAIEVGSRFGLWETVNAPTLSVKNRVTLRSHVDCLCHGCDRVSSVQIRYLIGGLSEGCGRCSLHRAREIKSIKLNSTKENAASSPTIL